MNQQEQMTIAIKLQMFQASYARCIDGAKLEEWPNFFVDKCVYKVTSEENVALGRPLGMIFADTRGMLHDRVLALREANIYEAHRYQHFMSMPMVRGIGEDGLIEAETGFLVIRIMRDGQTSVFATGRYLDKIQPEPDGRMLFAEKIVVCSSSYVHTLLALPL
jgi:3-phenylpropionate/cinnamic acid dioxygenase small subunit